MQSDLLLMFISNLTEYYLNDLMLELNVLHGGCVKVKALPVAQHVLSYSAVHTEGIL